MKKPAPSRKTTLIYLAIGLLIVAIVGFTLGGAGGFRLLRMLLLYGGAFVFLLWVLRRRRGGL